MKIAGIISEYNPFHKGHSYQIEELRKKCYTHIVCVMSPNFVQRGDVAIFEKRTRAALALEGGADLVIELPTPYALSSAGQFSFGGVSLLNSLGCIDAIAFGAESDDQDLFLKTASLLEEGKNSEIVKSKLKNGLSYQTAISEFLKEKGENDSYQLLKGANNLLGVEYIKQLVSLDSRLNIEIIKRQGEGHDNQNLKTTFPSASAIRKLFLNGEIDKAFDFLPSFSKFIINSEEPSDLNSLEQALMFRLKTIPTEQLTKYPDVNEGLEFRFEKALKKSLTVDEVIDFVKSKRYTLSRIRRIVINCLLDIPSECSKTFPPYIRILGFNEKGMEVVKLAKSTSTLPVSYKLKELSNTCEKAKKFADIEERATDVYLLSKKKQMPKGAEYKLRTIISK